METIAGIFNSLADARGGAASLRSLGIPEVRTTVLSPHTPENEIEARVRLEDTEQPGVGAALGGAVGAAFGVATGASTGAVVASLLVPGVGPVIALGILGAAILGASGATAGAFVGGALDKSFEEGLPHDELFVYEDALRHGRSIVIAFAEDEQIAENARAVLARAGAESIDAAREEWWLGLRDAELEHYGRQGGDFRTDERNYRRGFEAALHPACRGKSNNEIPDQFPREYGHECNTTAFRQGYERGQRYQMSIVLEKSPARDQRPS